MAQKNLSEKSINLKNFFSGIAIGLAIAFILFYFLGNRYEVKSQFGGISQIKLDKWTGRSWMLRYYIEDGNNIFFWEKLSNDKEILEE